jgi:hypothetical protein
MFRLLSCPAILLLALFSILTAPADESHETDAQQYVVSIERIWDRPGHSAFTDVLAFGDYLYCTFREGSGHVPGADGVNGLIRVIRSRDRQNWESVALLEERHVDLRDPKISITPDGRLMINMGASYYHGKERLKIESRVAFSETDGTTFSAPQKIVFPEAMITGGDWLWRVTWRDGVAWACVQQGPTGSSPERALRLVKSTDGIHYEEVAKLAIDAPTETTLRFMPDGTMIAMSRCEGKQPIGRIGTAKAPYKDWTWTDSNRRLGGPDFVQLPDGAWLAGSRKYDPKGAQTALWWFDPEKAEFADLLVLPSGGDNSYPGFQIDRQRGLVYCSYYSSHEGKAAIYLVTLRLDALAEAQSE